MMMWDWGFGWGWLMGPMMIAGMVAFWALVVLGIVFLVRSLGGSAGPGRGGGSEPEQILARRFAAGEINEEEYRTKLETLRSSGG